MANGNGDRLRNDSAEPADPAPASPPAGSATAQKTELEAWQDRCALVEAALAAANEVLQRELPAWQERCAASEAALEAAKQKLERDLPAWERRCAATEEALSIANRRLEEEIPRWRDRCELAEAALASHSESQRGRSVSFAETPSFLRFASGFSPARAVGHTKRRFGAAGDGGYVMLDDIDRGAIALSLGVGNETSWDLRMAELGATVHQYDHTVSAPAGQPPNIVFHGQQIVDVADGAGMTLEGALAVLEGPGADRRAILKMDIEGSEWPVLDAAGDDTLGRFDQILCEFHDFDRAADPQWFERACRVVTKLNRQFQVVHVHANNGEPVAVIGGVPFPSVLEVTFANRARYGVEATDETFPTELDRPNHPGRPDLWLGAFAFPATA